MNKEEMFKLADAIEGMKTFNHHDDRVKNVQRRPLVSEPVLACSHGPIFQSLLRFGQEEEIQGRVPFKSWGEEAAYDAAADRPHLVRPTLAQALPISSSQRPTARRPMSKSALSSTAAIREA